MKFLIYKKDDAENIIDLSAVITPPAVSETNRTQSVNYTIGGATVIDRISNSLKRRMELTIPVITKEQWNSVKAVLNEMSFMVIWDGKTYEMRLDGEIPTPVITAGADSYLAGDIKLALDEM